MNSVLSSDFFEWIHHAVKMVAFQHPACAQLRPSLSPPLPLSFPPSRFHPRFLPHMSAVAQTVKPLSMMRETQVRSLGWEDPLEKEMAIHSSTIAWKISWTEEPGRLQSMGSHYTMIKLGLFQECKDSSIHANQSMWYTILTNWKIKAIRQSQ